MGILTDILSSLVVGVVKVAIAGGGALARIGVAVARQAQPRIAAAYKAAKASWDASRRQRQLTPELNEINDRLARLGAKAKVAQISYQDKLAKEDLVHRRNQILGELQGFDEYRIAEQMADNKSGYDALTISDSTTHLLQSTVGQTFYGKPCPKCGWQMQLQWDRKKSVVGTDSFGWGCTGWYWSANDKPHRCEHWESLAPEDFDVFAKAKRPEFAELTPNQFAELVVGHSTHVESRMESVRNDSKLRGSVEAYSCPVHGESLVLRKKSRHDGRLLDMYFLGCPRWQASGQGCQFIVKLKSPAQLHAYLEAGTGEGVI